MFSMPTEPASIGHTLDAGFKLYVVSFKRVLVLSILASLAVSLPMYLMLLLAPGLADGSAPVNSLLLMLVVGFFVCMFVYMWLYLGTLYRIGAIARGLSPTVGQCMGVGLRKIFPVLLASMLCLLAILGGALLLLIPGLILALTLAFFWVCIVLDDDGIFESLRHSHRLVWGSWWRTATIWTVVFIVYYVIFLAIALPFQLVEQIAFAPELGARPAPAQVILSLVSNAIATAVTLPLGMSVLIAVYHDLKLRKEGQDLEARVEALTASA